MKSSKQPFAVKSVLLEPRLVSESEPSILNFNDHLEDTVLKQYLRAMNDQSEKSAMS